MSTQALLDKINAQTTQAVEKIEADTSAAVAAIEEAAKAEVESIETAAAAAAEKAAAAVERAALAKARQTGKLLVQTAKRQVFDEIMSAAQTAAVADDDKKAQAWSDQKASLEMYLSKQISS